ncbi:wHTH domain-containing protein [Streptomyces brasiliscabiei]|uniref:wHTH domain-containing protein n=1 Tax=Streptomyces brasiliscabiei TaxID=2736302 RepID=UPI001C12297B|nr:caspase family protein [Streptomyces brasiliscabiei]
MERNETSTGRRRALLFGVSETPFLARNRELDAAYPPLDFAARDVSLVAQALEQSEYEVTTECEDTSFTSVLAAITVFLAACEPGDTAFLYFSCHGVTIDGRDHLVLRDSQPGAPGPDGGHGLLAPALLRADPAMLLSALPHGVTAVVCLDVCRAEEPGPVSGTAESSWAGHEDAYWLYSCGPGQRAYADPLEGSWFARALATALSRVNPPTTFRQVADFAEQELEQLASRHPQVAPPSVGVRRPVPTQGGEYRDPVLCEGTEQTLDWTRIIRDSGLWQHTSGRPETHERVKEKLTALVRWVVDSGAQTRAYREDPWRDPLYPERLDARLTDLVARAGLQRDELLSPAETACLLSAAIVQEGIVAITLDQLNRLLPGQFDPGPRGREQPSARSDESDQVKWQRLVRDAARDVCRAHSLVVRTTETLRSRGLDQAVAAADHWLRHRFIAEWDGLWEPDARQRTAIDDLLEKVVEAVEAAADGPIPVRRTDDERQELDGLLRQVLGHLTVKPGLSPRVNHTPYDDQWDREAKPVRGNHWRGHQLARLLWTAGLLAASPRRLSSVLVDHLGAHKPLRAEEVTGALGSLDYDDTDGRTVESRGIAVRLRCPHPALHAAVEELARAADATVRTFGADAPAQPLLRGLPDRVTTDELRALPGRYKEPLERFRLAEDEIRPLLMGTQLYGDRMLAVRELYQNALDACRYREMRRRYGKIRSTWDGEIVFTQGWDGVRPYIECLDNGSGMSRTRLTSMFARAGKRYEQDPEFVQERRNWRRAGVVDRSFNSRFGIGVFSYFMLADEVVVWTRAVDTSGRTGAEPSLRVDIRSGSGLLQINTSDDPEVPEDGGTRVRLYLAEPQEGEQMPSLVETLRTHLWVTEHNVRAEERNQRGDTVRKLGWEPGQLAERGEWRVQPVPLRARHDEGAPEAWLVQGTGELLLDGILIGQAPEAYGYVVNLRERHAPVPSVDRNHLLSYDAELVMREVLEQVPEAAARFTDVSLPWLWRLAWKTPRLAVKLLESLPGGTTMVLDLEHGHRLVTDKMTLSATGCMPADVRSALDHHAIASMRGGGHEAELAKRWRVSRLGLKQAAEYFAPEGYPPPAALDAVLFRSTSLNAWDVVLRTAAETRRPVRDALRAFRRHAVVGMDVPEVPDIRVTNDYFVTPEAADLHYSYTSLAMRMSHSATDDGYFYLTGLRPGTERPPATHAPLLAVSALHGLSLEDTAALLQRLRTLNSTLPPPPELPDEVAKQRLTLDEVSRLVAGYTQTVATLGDGWDWDWLPAAIGPVDLLSRSQSPLSLPELVERIAQLSCFGYSLDASPTPEALEARTLPGEQQLLLSRDFDRQKPWIEGELSKFRLIEIAHTTGATLADAAERVNTGTAVTGVSVPAPPDEAGHWTVPTWFYSLSRTRARDADESPITGWELVGAFLNSSSAVDEFSETVHALDAYGLLDRQGATDAELERQATAPLHPLLRPFPFQNAIANCRFDQDGVTLAYLLALAAHFGLPLGDTAAELAELETALELRVPGIPSEFHALQPSESDYRFLSSRPISPMLGTTTPARLKEELSIGDILRFAKWHGRDGFRTLGKAYRHLTELCAAADIDIPGDFRGPYADWLSDLEPTDFDLAAFDRGLLEPGALGPLELVLVAGRLGLTLGETYDRYAPFACLGLDVTVAAPEGDELDLVPDWADVIILTARLTGRAPALSGSVPVDHITLCAEETERPGADVHARLRRYARLFTLTLPEAPEHSQRPELPARAEPSVLPTPQEPTVRPEPAEPAVRKASAP